MNYLVKVDRHGLIRKTQTVRYDILKVLGKDADFLYDTIETYIQDAQKANKSNLVEIWQTIKNDRKRHMHMLKEALEKEIHG
jgi:hypothetical protein